MNKAAQSLHFAVLFWVVGILGVMSLGLAPHFPSLPAGGDKILHASAFLALMIWPVGVLLLLCFDVPVTCSLAPCSCADVSA